VLTSCKFYKILLLAQLQNLRLSYQNFFRRGNISLFEFCKKTNMAALVILHLFQNLMFTMTLKIDEIPKQVRDDSFEPMHQSVCIIQRHNCTSALLTTSYLKYLLTSPAACRTISGQNRREQEEKCVTSNTQPVTRNS